MSSNWARFNEGDGIKLVTISFDYSDPDADSSFDINGVAATSGVEFGPIDLEFGANDIFVHIISVTAQDGISRKTYWLGVKRHKPPPFALFETIADFTTVWRVTADTLIHVSTPTNDGSSAAFLAASSTHGVFRPGTAIRISRIWHLRYVSPLPARSLDHYRMIFPAH